MTNVIQADFQASHAAAERRNYRKMINRVEKRGEISRSLAATLRSVVNLWFTHRWQGFIHPGKLKLSKMSGNHTRTIQRHMQSFEAWGYITIVSHRSGGGRDATRFAVNLQAIMEDLEPHMVPEVNQGRQMTRFVSPLNDEIRGDTVSPSNITTCSVSAESTKNENNIILHPAFSGADSPAKNENFNSDHLEGDS